MTAVTLTSTSARLSSHERDARPALESAPALARKRQGRNTMRRISHFAAALLVLGVLGTAAEAQTGDRRPAPRPTPTPPEAHDNRPAPRPSQPKTPPERVRFIVTSVSLHANNETGIDRTGSDEIVVAFNDRRRNVRMKTSVFGDFDTGDSQRFNRNQSCITPAIVTRSGDSWRCDPAGASGAVLVDVVVLEVDDWNVAACGGAEFAAIFSGTTGGCGADRVGRASIQLSQATLIRQLRFVGAERAENLRIGGYTLTYRIRRVADAQ
jgi:hypothetical protein